MKTEAVYKRAFNAGLGIVATVGKGERLPSDTVLTAQLAVSRSTVQKILEELARRGLITTSRERVVMGRPRAADRFPGTETIATSHQVERRFMEWMSRGDLTPGTPINVLELARQFGVSTTALRDFLNSFVRFGLVEKRPNARWIFKGMTRAFALELFDVREMFELRSAKAFIAQPPENPAWEQLRDLRIEHQQLQAELAERYQDFSALDTRLHALINEAANNRFIRDFHGIMAFIFHYHRRWNRAAERERNGHALCEHMAYIDALLSRDWKRVEAAAGAHLVTARATLVASLQSSAEPAYPG